MDKYEDLKWLVTSDSSDLRGNLFGKAFFENNGASSVNENAADILGKQAFDFMKAQNYTNFNASIGQSYNDVHQEFTDFIVNTALFHRMIDTPTGVSKPMEDIRNNALSVARQYVREIERVASTYKMGGFAPQDVQQFANLLKNNVSKQALLANVPAGAQSSMRKVLEDRLNGLLDNFAQDYSLFKSTGQTNFSVQGVSETIANMLVDASRDVSGRQGSYVTLNNPHAKAVYDNVFGRWDELSESAKAYYRNFIEVFRQSPSGSWEKVPEYEYGRLNDLNVRLNLIKYSQGSDLNAFGTRLPKYYDGPGGFTGIWYTPAGSSRPQKVSSPIPEDVFRNLYGAVYRGIKPAEFDNLPTTYPVPGQSKYFNVNVDDLVRKRIFAVHEAPIVEETPVEQSDKQYRLLDMINKGIIGRDTDGRLYRLVNGTKAYLGAEDPETVRTMKAVHSCYGTGLNAQGDDCKKFVTECLLSQDANSLSQCLLALKQKPDFFKVATDDIRNLHPVLALRILQKFGFHKYKAYDETAGTQIWKVESVSHWLNNYMSKKFSNVEIQKMITAPDQSYLLSYLDLISQFVNANPAVLNKSFGGSSDEAVGKLKKTEWAQRLGLEFQRPVAKKAQLKYDFNRFRGYREAARQSQSPFFLSLQNSVSTPFGAQFTPSVPMLQYGGGSKCEYVIKKFNEAGKVTGGKLLPAYIESVLQDLANRNKRLNETDKSNLTAKIEQYMEIEDELLRTLCYIDEYNKLLDTLKDYSASTLDRDYIKKFVERHNTLDSKFKSSESQIMDIINKIQDIIGKDGQNGKETNGNDYVPISVTDAN